MASTVEVVDEGDGITGEALPRIFTKFWHDARRGGTGLGLFIAKGIVDAHGGSIEAGRAPAGERRSDLRCPRALRTSRSDRGAGPAPHANHLDFAIEETHGRTQRLLRPQGSGCAV